MHYVVSDVHGRCEAVVAALRQAKLLDSDRSWCGGQARLTFLGDYFDRGPDGVAVVDLVRRLQDEAAASGGRVDAVIGNHEILALGMSRFGGQHVPSDIWSGRSFARSWALNGGQIRDQQSLTGEHIRWLSGLDSVGLGLAVAQGLASAVGAELAAEDTPGGGLTMVLSGPLAAEPGT